MGCCIPGDEVSCKETGGDTLGASPRVKRCTQAYCPEGLGKDDAEGKHLNTLSGVENYYFFQPGAPWLKYIIGRHLN
jgi:hypothetical protein